MRQMIKGLLAALAVTTAGVAPAAACGWGGGCCNTGYVSPCATTYAPTYSYSYNPCGTCDTGWAYERLAEPETQYYYVNQGPTYSGPGAFAPYGDLSGRGAADLWLWPPLRLPPSWLWLRLWHHRPYITAGISTATRRATTAIIAGAARAATTATRWFAATTDRAKARSQQAPARECERAFCFQSAHQPEPRRADIEREHRGVGDVEALDLAGHVEPRHGRAGLARQLPQSLAFGAEHQRQRLAQLDRRRGSRCPRCRARPS